MHEVKVTVGSQELTLETGRLARQANGAVFARYGGSAVIATVCCSSKELDVDFLPLSVDYNEKYYAAGKIPGGFLKREGRPKDREILVSRLIDRPMRPLFDKKFKRDIQIVPTTISTDQENPPDVVGMVAASAAVHVSDIPFDGPVGAVRVSYVDGEFVINPTFDQIGRGDLEITVAGTAEGITMVEGGAMQVGEDVLAEAIDAARKPIADLCRAQEKLREEVGKEKLPVSQGEPELPIADEVVEFARPKLEQACFVKGKMERRNAIDAVNEEVSAHFEDRIEEGQEKQFASILDDLEKKILRESVLNRQVRTDGRGPEDIRDITCEVGVLPRAHGSALFTRGETQALAVTTLGTVQDEQILDDIEGDRREHFMLHYNFPPFSVGETGRLGTGRREVGHGHLAQRAVAAVLPGKETFPYTTRIVSEILESNGSSSMATVCGSSMSLMDAGVRIDKPVAGIAMGLVQGEDKSVVISDITGEEDALGDMDFKVAGTEAGITAFQMDIKISNVDPQVMRDALEQARRGRMFILGEMAKVIERPRGELSEYAPRILSFQVDQEKIGTLIGPSGKTIKGISEKHDVTTNIDNDGTVTIYSQDKAGAEAAKQSFMALLEEPEVGKTYDGIVRRIVDFGAFIEFLPGREGLCHISKMADHRVESVSDVLELGQEVPVKIMEIDKMGRFNLKLIYDEENRERVAPRGDTGESGDGSSKDSRHGSRDGGRGRGGDRRR
ncbi:MAG: polyribonucleotide nucleotidyltransferase [Spirochaetales bacterium]